LILIGAVAMRIGDFFEGTSSMWITFAVFALCWFGGGFWLMFRE